MSRYSPLDQTVPEETDIPKSPGWVSKVGTDKRVNKIGSWRSGVVISFLALWSHAVLGVVLCAVGIYLSLDSNSHGWFALHSFGAPLPLLSARVLNFILDLLVSTGPLIIDVILAYVGLRTSTALWAVPPGIRVSDALAFNLIQLNVTSAWAILKTRISLAVRLGCIASIACGLVVSISGSLIFGYEGITVQRQEVQDIETGSNLMLLGSNTSGVYAAPDYSLLAASSNGSFPYSQTVLKTLMKIDTSASNQSTPSFNMSSESRSTMFLHNITMLLAETLVSTKLVDCQPIVSSNIPAFGFTNGGATGKQVWQDLPSISSSGTTSRFVEDLNLLNDGVGYDAYTFLMTLAEPTGIPAEDSRVLIVLSQRGPCTPDSFQTAYGLMSHAQVNFTSAVPTNPPIQVNNAVLGCRNLRAITRTTFAPNGTQISQTLESFYTRPVLGTLNPLYMYRSTKRDGRTVRRLRRRGEVLSDAAVPIYDRATADPGSVWDVAGLAPYVGIGSLLGHDMVASSTWKLPRCTGRNGGALVNNQTELQEVYDAWSRAVERVEYYENAMLEAFVKQNTLLAPTPVLIAETMYRLAVIPGALVIYGYSMLMASCLLLMLLVTSNRRNMSDVEPLSIWKVADVVGTETDKYDGGPASETSDENLEKELGGVKIKRRAKKVPS